MIRVSGLSESTSSKIKRCKYDLKVTHCNIYILFHHRFITMKTHSDIYILKSLFNIAWWLGRHKGTTMQCIMKSCVRLGNLCWAGLPSALNFMIFNRNSLLFQVCAQPTWFFYNLLYFTYYVCTIVMVPDLIIVFPSPLPLFRCWPIHFS